ncbi:hypothetical protein FRC19_004625 [Serendipita sp. 401]|nr:hypothetical protein FRC16_005140 [Serendipita sp. 398]KAG8823099.1 hypothetical protein FRC19_004625 [Serendipita sp. 401]KAG9055028.1 hypothetical protein FS842_003366 [Serendipita sp. 407]
MVQSYFPTTALDHAAAGIGAGTVAVLCMHPLDLIKVKFQVATSQPSSTRGIGKQIYTALNDIWIQRGMKGLYRGVGANMAGNAASWGLYFWFYTHFKSTRQSYTKNESVHSTMAARDYLIASAEASAVTALLTNPIWVVKVRLFTTNPDSPNAYRGLFHGLYRLSKTEGIRGLYRGTSLALFGVTNGSLQFMTYELMKNWGFARKRDQMAARGETWHPDTDRLSNFYYTIISGVSKLFALSATYPYQVVRARIQNDATSALYPNIRACVRLTWRDEGARGFYRGLGTNLIRVLPGTCITLVVYENIAWILRRQAAARGSAS